MKASCPVCGERLKVSVTRERQLKTSDGCKTLIIRRLRCDKCQRIHHELPDIIVPRKRYDTEVIEEVLSSQKTSAPCEESTVRRWKRWFALLLKYFQKILEMMKYLYDQNQELLDRLETILFSDPGVQAAGWLKDLVRIGVFINRWPQTRTAFQSD